MHATKEAKRGLSDPADALQRIDEVLRLSRSAIWEVDRRGTFTYASASHEALLGYRPEELVGIRTIHDFYPPDLPEDLRREVFEDWIGAGEEFTDLELPLMAKSGEIVWVASHGKPIIGAGGEVIGFRGTDVDITARKRDEERMRRNNERMRLAARAGGVGFWEYDYVADREDWDDGMLHLYGIQRADFRSAGSSWMEFVHPEDREDSRAVFGTLPAEGEQVRHEFRIVRPDGGVRHLASLWIVVRDAFGRASRMTGVSMDVTALREGEVRLREILDHLPFPVATSRAGPDFDWSDPRAEVLFLNQRFTELFGYTAEEIPTVSAWALAAFPEENDRRVAFAGLEQQVQRALACGKPVGPTEARVRTKDGRTLEVVIKAVAMGSELVTTFEDVTERNRAERLLRAGESSLRALIDNAPVGVVRLHLPSGRLWLNKEFTALLGYTDADVPTVEEWMQRAYPEEIYRREISAKWQRDLAAAGLQDGRLAPSEVRVVDKTGGAHEMQFSAVVLGEEVFGLWLDLTERNRAERLLREQREQLAHVGRVSALGQLAASLAHELDQPLGAILNNAETACVLLENKRPDLAELGAIMHDILEDDRRAGAVLDRIRAMVQRQAFQAGEVDLPSLCREVASLVQPAAAQRGIKLEFSGEPGVPTVEGDRVLLQQALLNLVLNSVDAIGDRIDGCIEVRAGQSDEAEVSISVGDNAGGVPPAEVEHLFEPFHTTKESGLGMGLPIVHSIVEQHGGRLRIDNQPGRGLTVHLVLPRWRGPSAP